MNRIRKLFALVLCLCICFYSTPDVWAGERFNNNEGYGSGISYGHVKELLDGIIKKYPAGTTWTDSFDGGIECYGFAKMVVYELFGKAGSKYRSWTITSGTGTGMNNIGQIKDYSVNELSSLLSLAKPGDILQFGGNSGKQHSAIVYSVQSNSATLYECNWAGGCKITLGANSLYEGNAGFIAVRKAICGNTLTLFRASNYDDIDIIQDSPDLTVTANDATGVTSNDATLTGFIHFGNYQPTHWGVDCGTSSSNLPCVIFNDSSKQVINSSTGVSISFNFKNDSTSDPNSPSTPYYPLKANTTYNYRFWVKYGNDQYAHSEIKQFTTGNATIPSFSNISVSNITSTTARLNYTINYGADNVPKYYGLYLGTSEGEMTKAVLNMQQYNESTYVNSTHQPIAGTNLEKRWPSGPINGNSIAFGSEGPTLSPATTYYYKLWITDNSGDHEYCSAVQSFTTSGSAVAVTGITLDSASLTMTGGTSQKLTATVSPSNATNKNVTWSSSNPSVATVSSDGVVNAVQGGTATITATTSDGGKTASCTVTVKDVHTFRFDANGGSGSMNSVSACMGEAVVFPPCAFTRPGYTFLGWYGYRANDRTFFVADVGWRTEEAIAQAGLIKQIYHDRLYTVIDNSWIDGVNGPCTFIMYAAWKANDYTVTYDANGGTGAPAAQTKTKGTNLILSSAQPTHASSSAGSYTVTLNANGGSVSPTSLNAVRTTSYTFKNWNTAADGSGTGYAPGAAYSTDANVTLYAQWESKTTTAAVALPTPTRDRYVFKGWGTSSTSTSGVTGSYTPTRDLTLYAIWQSPDFILPASLTTIEDEAFAGGAFRYVQLPEGVSVIRSRAFADCPNLTYIYIPEATGTIARDAFEGVTGLTILGRSGSYAEFYAQRNGIAFVAVE